MGKYSKTIYKGIFFVIGFLVIVFILQSVVLFSIKRIDVGEFGVLNKIDQGGINADIIVSGSSRAYKGINPEVIDSVTGMNCFNLATNGTDLGVQLPKLKWYLNHNSKPRIIIQDLSQFGEEISSTIFEPYKYLAYLKDDSLYQGLKRVDKRFWMHKYFFPSNLKYYNFDFYYKLTKELRNSSKGREPLIKGFSPDNSAWRGDLDLLRTKYPEGLPAHLPEDYKSYISELIQLCKTLDIILIIAVLPNYPEISEVISVIDDVGGHYASLQNGEDLLYFDYTESDLSKDKTNFYNHTHLNLLGAGKLSRQLGRDLLEYVNL